MYLRVDRSDEDEIRLGGTNVGVDATRAEIVDFVETVLSDLAYHFGRLDLSNVRMRARQGIQTALPTMLHRYPKGAEIARLGELSAVGGRSGNEDGLFGVEFRRGNDVLEPLGMVDLQATPPRWVQQPSGIGPEFAQLLADAQTTLLGVDPK